MKVLALNYEFPPLGGGAGNATSYVLKEFAGMGVACDLVTSSVSGSLEVDQMAEGIRIHRVPLRPQAFHFQGNRDLLLYSWRAYHYARNLVRSDKYDLCHAYFGIPCGMLAYLLPGRLPYVVSLRGSDVEGFNQRFTLFLKVLRPVVRRVWRRAGRVVANSQQLRQLALKVDPSVAIEVVPNGVDTKTFRPAAPVSSSGQVPKILCVSRLIPRKDVTSLIQAMPRVIASFGDTRLQIIGGGPLELELRQMSRDLGVGQHIEILGYTEHSQMPRLYAESTVFVLPSVNEGMSNAVLEAMACGLPVVVTDTGDATELVNGNGYIVPMRSPAALAEAIIAILQAPRKERLQMGERSRAIGETYSWAAVAERYLSIFTEVSRGTLISASDVSLAPRID